MRKGFTLLELIVVVVILGILATLAVSQYTSGKERALGKEAIGNLKLIAAAERIYRMESGSYYPNLGSQSDAGTINTNLKLSLNENNWDYSITGGESSFTAYANRNGSGGYLDCVYSLAHDDDDGEPDPNSSCP